MLKYFIRKFYKNKPQHKELVLIGSCFTGDDDNYFSYEETEQALEYIYPWYAQTDAPYSARLMNGGYHAVNRLNIAEMMEFSHYMHSLQEKKNVPVVMSNSSDSFTESLAVYDGKTIGVVNLSQHLDLSGGATLVPMQAYSNLMAHHSNAQMLSLGVYEDAVVPSEWEVAESMNVSWMTHLSFYSKHMEEVNKQLERFLHCNEVIALHVDLKSVVRGMTVQPPFALEFSLVLSVINQVMESDKTVLIQLTGDSEALIFSGEVKKILDVIRAKRVAVQYAA